MRQLVISKSITPREYRSIDRYFNDVEKITMISQNEEVLLAERIRQGDRVALERLTTSNLRFVISVAKQYQNQGLTLGDLINEGNIGLIKAATRYDPSKGFKFISYAVWWIRQSIIAAISEKVRIVRLPYSQLTLLSKVYAVMSKLEQKHNRKPSCDEMAEHLDIEPDEIAALLSRSGINCSLDEPFDENADHTLNDILHSKDSDADRGITMDSICEEIHQSLQILNRRDRELLILYFGLGISYPLTLEEIGSRFNITKEHVGRLKEKALLRLRESSNALNLKSCLSLL
ncbi:MAG TPA: RNA polymerase sigma factor RpoD/SigA [Mucilaginibacter sp.]|jgi:RNA polymerase primary sigma factor